MHVPRIVLDTNVLVAALRSRRGMAFRLMSLLGTGRFETAVSVPLIFEYEDVLSREAIGVPASAASDVIDYLCTVSHRQDVKFLWRPFLKDPADDFILELAVASHSEAIVTHNVKDFRGAERFGVHIRCPAEFLAQLGGEL